MKKLSIPLSQKERGVVEQKETPFCLKTDDGFSIHGVVTPAAAPAGRAVVLCHGLGGNISEHLFQDGKRFFAARGYDVIRFNFYSFRADARKMKDASLATHARDLDTVLRHFAPAYKKIFIAGHSYGGTTLLVGNPQNIAAASFWDASFAAAEDNPWLEKSCVHVPALGGYLFTNWCADVFIGTALVEESRGLTRSRLAALAGQFKTPALVAAAGGPDPDNIFSPAQRELFDRLGSAEKEIVAIPGAGHYFDEDNVMADVLEKTYAWFKKF